MPDKARIGIIGTGSWATNVHIPALIKNANAEVVAICDRDQERLDRAGDVFKIKARFTDHVEMLEKSKLDGAMVVTSAASHYGIVRDCLMKDLHVLCEKPLTITAKHARALADLAAERKRELIIGYPANYSSASIQIRDALSSGRNGEVRLVNGYFNSTAADLFRGKIDRTTSTHYQVNSPSCDYNDPLVRGGGHGNIQMTHLFGLLYFLAPLRPVTVQARMLMLDQHTDLEDAMLVTFDNGAIASFTGTAQSEGGWGEQLLINTGKSCVTYNTSKDVASITRRNGEKQDFAIIPDMQTRWLVAGNLVDVVLGRAGNGSPADCGLRAVETIEAAYLSAAKNGETIKIDELYL